MFEIWVENEKKEKLELTNSPYYESIKIEGLLPPQATINSTKVVNQDGEIFNSANVGTREIELTIKPAKIIYIFQIEKKCKYLF